MNITIKSIDYGGRDVCGDCVRPRAEWQMWTEWLRLFADPPPALVSSIAWSVDGSTIINVNVWDSASAVADFYLDRVQAVIDAHGQPAYKPGRHGEPVAVYIRSQ